MNLPHWLPDDMDEFLVDVGTIQGWQILSEARSLKLPLIDHPGLHEAWVRCLYVQTKRDRDFAKAIDITRARSGGTQRRWLGVDGATDLGKTDLAVNYGIQNVRFEGHKLRYRDTRHHHLPVIYIEATTKRDGLGLLRSICRFAGIPDSGTDVQLWERLRQALPFMGTVVIIVDDAHMLTRTRASSTTLTNNLREMLRLPVTFVYVGAGLDGSALLRKGVEAEYESARQLRRRAETLDLTPLLLPNDKSHYEHLIKGYARAVTSAIPGMKFNGLQKQTVRDQIMKETGGNHGTIFCILKDATCYALSTGSRDVTASVIDRFLPGEPGQPHPINPDEWPDDVLVSNVG